ncbi:MAG: gliding motility-associated C-terminal domain-containing protein [Bacteroidetes bacterium]|jgi:gliding motility-associated-like protein|nr:gliding motility-associated C-terminal domain-containing protein [Bacteroidota bacterium]MDF1864654.1 gliding motility-associated C-terminal domain-containing protein [Saprospiraceae bacterium]
MKNIYITVFILISCLCSFSLESQTIVRSVICSMGATQSSTDGTILTSTFGQCPGCSTYVGTDGSILTQGFQQPINSDDDPNQPDCAGIADFEFDENSSICGTTYSFFYIGQADITQATFEWNFGADAFPQTSSSNNPLGVSFSTIGTKTVTLRVVTADCDVTSELDIDAIGLGFSVNANIINVDCKGGNTGVITLETNNGMAPFTYVWSNGINDDMLTSLVAGDYSYTVTDAVGCEVTNIVAVPEPDSLQIDFNISKATCDNSADGIINAIVSGGAAPYTYEWSTQEITNTIQNLNPGSYSVIITDNNGCVLDFDNEAMLGEKCRPTVYTVISPNDDGMNDVWEIENIQDFPDNRVKIYNRWGNLIYEKEGYANDWKGTDNSGKALLAGAYYYVLDLNNGSGVILTGPITLIR